MRFRGMVYASLLLPLLAACNNGGGGSSASDPPSTLKPVTYGNYSVFAWNDLGMHCLSPSYEKVVILPPYNTLVAQVVLRGNPPQLVTAGVTVEYSIANNTVSHTKRTYGQFWTYSYLLFGSLFGLSANLPDDIGLQGKGLSGTMDVQGNRFEAVGIPVVPVDDSNVWNPYQIAEIVVRDGTGTVVARTRATIPTSDEINCGSCHGTPVNGTNVFQGILEKHDKNSGTNLSLISNQPVLCASCHASPALGAAGNPALKSLSQAIHGFHATVGDRPVCYDCHPGAKTRCNRSLKHTAADGNCSTCHGALEDVAGSIALGRTPWLQEPKCANCHGSSIDQVDTGSALYRFSDGHGGMRCSACHGSPHAMLPTNGAGADHEQSLQYQGYTGAVKTLGSCGVCHPDSRGSGDVSGFAEHHGSASPSQPTGCNACHTAMSSDTAHWPHAYQWRNTR
jgi:hypothetical protein